MLWVVAFVILLVALMIPILAIVMDSPAVRKVLESRHGVETGRVAELSQKVEILEDQVDDLTRAIEGLKEEQLFLHRLLENPERQAQSKRLPPAT
jgi:hypothetical protein